MIPFNVKLKNISPLNSNLTANGQPFRYAYQNGKYGHIVREADTDVFVPFSSAEFDEVHVITVLGNQNLYWDTFIINENKCIASTAYADRTQGALYTYRNNADFYFRANRKIKYAVNVNSDYEWVNANIGDNVKYVGLTYNTINTIVAIKYD